MRHIRPIPKLAQPGDWTFNNPMVPTRVIERYRNRNNVKDERKRRGYTPNPDPTLFGEVLLRSFKEGA